MDATRENIIEQRIADLKNCVAYKRCATEAKYGQGATSVEDAAFKNILVCIELLFEEIKGLSNESI